MSSRKWMGRERHPDEPVAENRPGQRAARIARLFTNVRLGDFALEPCLGFCASAAGV